MNKKNVQATGLGCGLLIICILTAGTFWQLRGLAETESTQDFVSIQVDAPNQTAVDEPYSIVIKVYNFAFEPGSVTLHSLDFSDAYLDGVIVLETSPTAERDLSIPLVGFQTFLFRQPIAANETAVVEFTLTGEQAAELEGVMDVCINTASLCERFELQTVIVAGE